MDMVLVCCKKGVERSVAQWVVGFRVMSRGGGGGKGGGERGVGCWRSMFSVDIWE